jgi:hypothetical protein
MSFDKDWANDTERYAKDPEFRERKKANARRRYELRQQEVRDYVSRYQMERKIKAVQVLGGKCYRCPEAHPAALQFHHRDPATKSFIITTKQLSSPRKYPWEMILAEIAKCDLLCANCHFKHHCGWEIPNE